MVVGSPISTYARKTVNLGSNRDQMGYAILNTVVKGKSISCCFSLPHSCSMDNNYSRLSVSNISSRCPTFNRTRSLFPRNKGMLQSITVKGSLCARIPLKRHFNISFPSQNMSMRLLVSDRGVNSKIKDSFGHVSWFRHCAATSVIFGLLVCYSSSGQAHAETDNVNKESEDDCASPHSKISHGKKVYTDYSVIGIPGDGRCLFRSVVHGACIRSGKQAPREGLQRELADELRSNVADEFIKRRQETEWFVEGDFDSYVAQIRKPHVWGGEPELLMASHVLRMPITVYMYDKDVGGLISIAEYGQEYGKDNPIRLLYHGFGHYDSLQIPGRQGGAVSKL